MTGGKWLAIIIEMLVGPNALRTLDNSQTAIKCVTAGCTLQYLEDESKASRGSNHYNNVYIFMNLKKTLLFFISLRTVGHVFDYK